MLVVGDFERIRVAGSLAVLSTWKEPPTVIIKKKEKKVANTYVFPSCRYTQAS